MNLIRLADFYQWTDTRLQRSISSISDEDFEYKDGEHRSLRELIEHYTLSYQYLTFTGEYAERIIELSGLTRKELINQWSNAVDEFVSYLPKLEQQEYYVKMADDQKKKVNRVDYVLIHTDHLTYHRGQISSKIRELGYVPPNTDYWSFLSETI